MTDNCGRYKDQLDQVIAILSDDSSQLDVVKQWREHLKSQPIDEAITDNMPSFIELAGAPYEIFWKVDLNYQKLAMTIVQELDKAGLVKFERLDSGKFDWMYLYCVMTRIETILKDHAVFNYPDLYTQAG